MGGQGELRGWVEDDFVDAASAEPLVESDPWDPNAAWTCESGSSLSARQSHESEAATADKPEVDSAWDFAEELADVDQGDRWSSGAFEPPSDWAEPDPTIDASSELSESLYPPDPTIDLQLRRYIRHGYTASAAGGVTGRAVGFVMTTYRKPEIEIVGALLEPVDIAQILANNRDMENDQGSEAEIDEAIERAKQSQSLQDQLFAHIEGYDPNATAAVHTFGPEEVLSFLEGVLPRRGCRIRDRLHHGRVLELELPEEMRGRHSEFGGRTVVRVTVDRRLASRDERNVSMDFASVFFSDLVEFAKSPEFGGEHASLAAPQAGVLGIHKVRWQNDQGLPRWEVLVPVFLPAGNDAALPNPDFFGSLLHASDDPADAPDPGTVAERRGTLKRLDECAAVVLAERCTALRHPNDLVLLAAADLYAD